MITRSRFHYFTKMITNGLLGILAEIALVAFIFIMGLVICGVWWRVFH